MRSWDTMSRMRKGAVPDSRVNMSWEFDGRARTVSADQLRLAQGTMEAVRAAWIAGGPDDAVTAFVTRIGDSWYRQRLAAYDARARVLDQLPDAPDMTPDEEEDYLDLALDDEAIGAGYGYGDIPPEEVLGEEIQGEISEYDMVVHSL